MAVNHFPAVIWLGSIQPDCTSIRMIFNFLLRLFNVCIGNRNEEIVLLRLLQNVIDQNRR